MIVTGIIYKTQGPNTSNISKPPVVGDIMTDLQGYGTDPNNYEAAAITSMNPVTIKLTTKTNSVYGRYTVIATKDTVTFIEK